jgi:hypothetical protein
MQCLNCIGATIFALFRLAALALFLSRQPIYICAMPEPTI